MRRIDKIIKKAECIKKYLTDNGKKIGNIETLIKSLESYRDNVGDIGPVKMFYIGIVGYGDDYFKDKTKFPYYNTDALKNPDSGFNERRSYGAKDLIGIRAIEFTKHIHDVIINNKGRYVTILSMPPVVLEYHVADAVFDVQTYYNDDVALSVELIKAGFRPMQKTCNWVCDFEIDD